MSDSLSRRPPFPQRRYPTATPPGENRGEPVRAQRGGLAPAPVGGDGKGGGCGRAARLEDRAEVGGEHGACQRWSILTSQP